MSKIVLTLTGVRNVTEMVKNVGLIAQMAEVIIYVPDRCSAALRAALSAEVQLNVIMPDLKFTVSQNEKELENADVIIISGFVAPSKTIDQFIALADATMKNLFKKLTLKEGVKIIINGGARGLICAYFIKQLKIVEDDSITVFEPYFTAGTKTLGTMIKTGFVYPTMNDFKIYPGENTPPATKAKLEKLKKFPLALDTIEATVLGETIQASEAGDMDVMDLRGKFPTGDEQDLFDIGNEIPVFIPSEGLGEDFRKEMKTAVKNLWMELQKMILEYVTTKD